MSEGTSLVPVDRIERAIRPLGRHDMTATEFLTTEEVCPRRQVPQQTMSRWIKPGTLPAIRLGPRQLRFPKAELRSWLEAQRTDRVPAAVPKEG